jgi:GABA(A) receptor-associated protein
MFQTFKKHPLYYRKEQSARIIAKYPDRVPVIVEKHATATVKMDKNKFLVPKDSTIGSFVHVIRKRLHLSEKEAIFLMCQNTIPPTSEVMSIVYERHKDKEDNFLYFVLLQENTFG